MARPKEIYLCEKCKIMVLVLRGGAGTMTCCNQPMTLIVTKDADEGREKHLPVIEQTADGYQVTVGSVPHPMTEEHHIEWIELSADGVSQLVRLDPTGEPNASFCTDAEHVAARASCNVHGVWETSV